MPAMEVDGDGPPPLAAPAEEPVFDLEVRVLAGGNIDALGAALL